MRMFKNNKQIDYLYDAFLSLENHIDCENFFEDLCTIKELEAMAQRLEAAKLLLSGKTYEEVIKLTSISSTTLSRISKCIQFGKGGYAEAIKKSTKK